MEKYILIMSLAFMVILIELLRLVIQLWLYMKYLKMMINIIGLF